VNDTQIITFLETHHGILNKSSYFSDGLRFIGYWVIRLLSMLLDAVSSAQVEALRFLNFTTYQPIKDLSDKYQVIGLMVAGVCLATLGVLIMHKKERDLDKVVQNFLVATVLFLSLNLLLTNLSEFVRGASRASSSEAFSQQIIRPNLTDLYAMDKAEWNTGIFGGDTGNYPNFLSSDKDFAKVEINSTLVTAQKLLGDFFKDPNAVPLSDKAKEALAFQLDYYGSTPVLRKMSNYFLGKDDMYYRYSWNFWTILFTLIGALVVSVFLLWRLFQIMMEMGITSIWGQISSFTDIHSGKRNWQIINKLVSCAIVIIALFLLQNIFVLMWQYIDTLGYAMPLNVLAKLAVAFFIIQGPDIIEQLYGIDAGTSGLASSVTGLVQGVRGISMLGKGVGKGLSTAANTPVKVSKFAGSTVGGATKGIMDAVGYTSAFGEEIGKNNQPSVNRKANWKGSLGNDLKGNQSLQSAEKETQAQSGILSPNQENQPILTQNAEAIHAQAHEQYTQAANKLQQGQVRKGSLEWGQTAKQVKSLKGYHNRAIKQKHKPRSVTRAAIHQARVSGNLPQKTTALPSVVRTAFSDNVQKSIQAMENNQALTASRALQATAMATAFVGTDLAYKGASHDFTQNIDPERYSRSYHTANAVGNAGSTIAKSLSQAKNTTSKGAENT